MAEATHHRLLKPARSKNHTKIVPYSAYDFDIVKRPTSML